MRKAIIGVLVLLVGVPMVWAGTGEWTHADDPEGGYIHDIAVSHQNPDKVYAATFRGIYRSDDGGANWYVLENSIPDCRQVVVDPGNDDVLYAFRGWGGDNLYRSTDGGNTWTQLEIIPGEGHDVHTQTLTDGILYIGVDGQRIFESTDSGSSWTELTPLPNSGWIPDILVDGSTIYVALWEHGVYRSDDGGSTWALKINGLGSLAVRCLALDSTTSPSLLLAGTHEREGGGWMYRSSDRGESWTQAGSPGWNYVEEIIILPGSPRTVYAQYHGGLRVSTDVGSGDTWEDRNNGLEGGGFHTGGTLTLSPSHPTTMYIGSHRGVFRTDNAGGQWIPRYGGMHAYPAVWNSIAYDPIHPLVAYAAVEQSHPLLVTYDGGASWEVLSTYPYWHPRYVATHPTDPSILYTTQWHAVVRSTDGGDTWTDLNNGGTIFGGNNGDEGCFAVAIDPRNPDVLYASTDRGGHLMYKSTDGGDTWTVKNAGLPGPPGEGDAERRIRQMVMDPRTSAVYAVFSRQYSVYRTTDGGQNWTPASTGVSQTGEQRLTIDPSTTPSTLYLAAAWDSDRGLYVSKDDGATWRKIMDGDAVNVAIDPLDPHHLFVARWGAEIWESNDGGATWTTFTEWLSVHQARVSINPHNPYILTAGTYGGMYQYVIPHITVSVGEEYVNPGGKAYVPIFVSDLTGFEVYSGEFSVFFDPLVLTFGGARAGNVSGIQAHHFAAHSPARGRAEFAFAGVGALEGEGVLATLEFSVNPDAPVGYTTPVNLKGIFNEGRTNVLIQGGAVHVSAIPVGDVSQNGVVAAWDASLILRHVVGHIDLREDFPDEGMFLRVCDVTRNGMISAFDAAWILRFVVGLIPGLPYSGKVVAGAGTPRMLSVSEGIVGEGRVRVRLGLDDLTGVLGGTVRIGYDASKVRAIRAERGEALSGFLFESRSSDGELRFSFAGAEGAHGSGDLTEIAFEVLPGVDAADAMSSIRVLDVELNEGGIPVYLAAQQETMVPQAYVLHQNFPNPFNPQTTIRYALAGSGGVELAIYDGTGRRVRTLVNGVREVGTHAVVWDGRSDGGEEVASGVYFCRLSAGGFVDTRKLVFVR